MVFNTRKMRFLTVSFCAVSLTSISTLLSSLAPECWCCSQLHLLGWLVGPRLPLPGAETETHCLKGATCCIKGWDSKNSSSKQIIVALKMRGEIMKRPRENLKDKKTEGKQRNRKTIGVAKETKCETYLCVHKTKVIYKEPRRKRLLNK